MSFKLPDYPSPKATASEVADFAEIMAMLHGACSAQQMQAHLGRVEDNLETLDDGPRVNEFYKRPEGPADTDDINEMIVNEVLTIFQERNAACNGSYPFHMRDQSFTLIYEQSDQSNLPPIYEYLLLATRLNMSTCRTHDSIDGALLLEELSAVVLGSYLGNSRSQTMIFGTTSKSSFEERVNQLCINIKEGVGFQNKDSGRINAQDDGLDVLAWIPFSDTLASKLAVFGQCKTGTKWEDKRSDLNPVAFLRRWTIDGSFALDPVRAFLVAEAQKRDYWYGTVVYTGLFFDRCRIVDFAQGLNTELSDKIKRWTIASKKSLLSQNWASRI